MKLILALLITLASAQTLADYQCSREVSPGVFTTAIIKRWPNLQIERNYTKCEKDANDVEKCALVTDTIASPFEVCGVSIDTTHSCRTTESTANGGHILDVDCSSGIRVNFNMNRHDMGRLTCYQGNMVYSMWDVGTCQVVP